jgi:hypothetical protein
MNPADRVEPTAMELSTTRQREPPGERDPSDNRDGVARDPENTREGVLYHLVFATRDKLGNRI